MATWALGIAVFFDDYANTLVVGNTMRPITDRLKISREKLSYIVDSTAAPVAAIAFVTTWIGAELGYIENSIKNIPAIQESVYSIFVNSLSYSFYPIFTLAFILILILKGKDFGPMYKAEITARQGGTTTAETTSSAELEELSPKEGIQHKGYNALIPVLLVIIGTIVSLLYTGFDANVWHNDSLSFGKKISFIIGNSDS